MPLTDAEREQIRAWRAERLSYEAIGRRLHRWEEVIRRACNEMGLPPLERGPDEALALIRERTAAIQDERATPLLPLLNEGLSWSQIAERLGLTKNQVAGRLWRSGYCQSRDQRPAAPRVTDIVAQMPSGGCNFIAGEGRDLRPGMYCGKPVAAHGLCAEHAERCWVKAATKVNLGPSREAA